jgi:ABC-2 type transport system ATP-binding protein
MITLKVDNINMTFNKRSKNPTRALVDFSMSINPGEVVGLIGPNGAGKTTLIRLIMGFERPDSGSISVFGIDNSNFHYKEFVGFQSDNQYRTKALNTFDFLQFHSKLAGLRNNQEQIKDLLDYFKLSNALDKSLVSLSKGMRQKVELIVAFLGKPKLVILDEPTAALDPPSVFELRDFITEQKSRGVTILFSSHHLTEVEKVSDRIVFIDSGELKGDVNTHDVGPGFIEEAFRRYESERRFI